MRRLGFLLLVCGVLVGAGARASADWQVVDAGREAFARPLDGLTDAERERFFRGRSLFNQSWVVAPASACRTASRRTQSFSMDSPADFAALRSVGSLYFSRIKAMRFSTSA